jgi:hypothetical protein
MAGFDDRNVIGLLQSAIEERFEGSWASRLSLYNPNSDRAIEEYGIFGGFQKMREWIGERQAATIAQRNYEIRNRKYENSLPVKNDMRNRDKSNLLEAHIGNFAEGTIAYQWEDLLISLINAAGSQTCFDGKAFFATDHVFESETAQSNTVNSSDVPALNVGTATAPTGIEMANVILGLVSHMLTFKDDKNRYVNGNARNFEVVVSTVPMFTAVTTSLDTQQLAAGTGGNVDNPLRGMLAAGFKFTPKFIPDLTSATAKVRLFNTDGSLKPFVLQEERAMEIKVLGPGSDYDFFNDASLYGVQTNRGAGYGDWKKAIEGTLS